MRPDKPIKPGTVVKLKPGIYTGFDTRTGQPLLLTIHADGTQTVKPKEEVN